MAHEITPSRQKFRIAKRAVQWMLKNYAFPENLKGVFVTGSVGSNIAFPHSDIDIGFVFEREPEHKHSLAILKGLKEEFGKALHVKFWDSHSLGRSAFSGHSLPIVPVFDRQNYLKNLIRVAILAPSKATIRTKYGKTGKGDIKERVKFKQSIKGRKRFLPR